MKILDLRSSAIQTEPGLTQVLQSLASPAQEQTLIAVEAIGKTEKHLLEAGERSAGQDLVLASTLAEGIRTFHTQFASQLTSGAVWSETKHLISSLFEELSNLLQGVFLIGELSPRGRQTLLAFGERTAAVITAQTLKQQSLKAQAVADRSFYLALAEATPERTRRRLAADFRGEIQALADSRVIPVIPASLKPLWSGK